MATPFHTGVTLRGFHFEDFLFTVKLAAGIVAADIGKALAVDTGAANKFKLAGSGDVIFARLEVVESRVVEGTLLGTAAFKFMDTLPIKDGETVTVGMTVMGAGAGEVKPRTQSLITYTMADADSLLVATTTTPQVNDYSLNYVAEVVGALATVVRI